MVLVIEKKFLEGTWWKYGLVMVAAKLAMWTALGYHWDPGMDLIALFRQSGFVVTVFAVTAFLPFAAGRLQMRRLFWFGLVGFLISESAYLFLALERFGAAVPLLPFIAYLQLYVTSFGLGVVVEFGRFVYLKLAE
ncbi:MAG TPA: hypothetical protein VJ694_05285 [Patescibacteria group bacterium]|nr:hypothetical protein [Patescibacteria group bacterium]